MVIDIDFPDRFLMRYKGHIIHFDMYKCDEDNSLVELVTDLCYANTSITKHDHIPKGFEIRIKGRIETHLASKYVYLPLLFFDPIPFYHKLKDRENSACEIFLSNPFSGYDNSWMEHPQLEVEERTLAEELGIDIVQNQLNEIRKKEQEKKKFEEELRIKKATECKEEIIRHYAINKRLNLVNTYLIFDNSSDLYKIGKSVDPYKRIKSFCNPRLQLLYILPDDKETELHYLMKSKREHGEWFRLTDNDVNSIVNKYPFFKV